MLDTCLFRKWLELVTYVPGTVEELGLHQAVGLEVGRKQEWGAPRKCRPVPWEAGYLGRPLRLPMAQLF